MLPTGLFHNAAKGLDVQVLFRMHDSDPLTGLARVIELVMTSPHTIQHPALLLQPLDYSSAFHWVHYMSTDTFDKCGQRAAFEYGPVKITGRGGHEIVLGGPSVEVIHSPMPAPAPLQEKE